MTDTRSIVLSRVRAALADAQQATPAGRRYRMNGQYPQGHEMVVAQFRERLEDYRATVVRCPDADQEVGDAVRDLCRNYTLNRVVVPQHLPGAWTDGLDATRDTGDLTAGELDAIPAVVTGCVGGIAETGTIMLDSGAESGRRLISLIPDTHICVIGAAQIVQTVPEGLQALDPTRPITLISGPSATSDIELSRVEGVHGPRRLIVIIAG